MGDLISVSEALPFSLFPFELTFWVIGSLLFVWSVSFHSPTHSRQKIERERQHLTQIRFKQHLFVSHGPSFYSTYQMSNSNYEMGHLPVPTQPNHPQQRFSSEANSPWDSVEDLPEPVLPWMRSESRHSFGASSRSSVESNSLHVMKRYVPDPDQKKRQIWTKRKWWILFSNTLVNVYFLF